MKTLLFLLFLATAPTSDYCDMAEVRTQFHSENDSEERLEKHIANMKNMSCSEVTPYLACAIMQQAEHSSWPPTQISYFNEGKEMLETYINNHPNNLEARYVRYLVQKGSPSFLGYKDNMTADQSFIKNQLGNANLPSSLVTKMRDALN